MYTLIIHLMSGYQKTIDNVTHSESKRIEDKLNSREETVISIDGCIIMIHAVVMVEYVHKNTILP